MVSKTHFPYDLTNLSETYREHTDRHGSHYISLYVSYIRAEQEPTT